MPKYLAIHVVILAGLVMAVTFLVFQARALTIKVDRLESERDRKIAAPPGPESRAPTPLGDPAADEMKPTYVEHIGPSPRNINPEPAPSGAAAAAPAETAKLTPAQEKAVAEAVDRILKEKYGELPIFGKPGDLEKILANELNLTESQKARIADLLKRKGEELRALFEGKDPMSSPTIQKGMEIEKRYESLIKNELDSAQQAKYDQLKKDGKIPQGVRIQIEAGDGSRKEELEVR